MTGHGLTLRPYQREAVDAVQAAAARGVKRPLVVLPTGCHRAGQEILMFDGSTRPVEHIKHGDLLMGPDSVPRRVLALARGRGPMMRVRPASGEPWVVNDRHVLTLVEGHSRDRMGAVRDVPIEQWMRWTGPGQRGHKLFRVSVASLDSEPRSDRELGHSSRGHAELTRFPPAIVSDFTVEPTGTVEDYYGFTLDGDGRYLLGDFTVTHNSGKTCMFSALIATRGGSALVLAHRDELLQQAAAKIRLADPALGLAVGFVAAERDDVGAPIVLGSVQTLARERRLARLPTHFDTVVIDESHHASARSYRRVLEHVAPSPVILGVTATPARSDGKPLGAVWEEIVYQRGILEMIDAGYLVDVRGIRVGLEALDLEQVKRSGGDFQDDALGDALEAAAAPRHVLAGYQQHAAGRKTLVFVPTVKLAYHVASVFREAGIAAEGLDGTATPERRRATIGRLQSGETTVLVNAALFLEGFDEPSISCIIVATPTRSQVRYTQTIGRGLRPFPGKDDCLVLDVVGASDKLDLQTLPRLFGITDPLGERETVTQALDRQAAERDAQTASGSGGKARREGAMRSRHVQLLRAHGPDRRLRWLRHNEHWLLAAGQTVIALVPNDGRWGVLLLDRDRVRALASDVDLAYAHGIAEDYVKALGAHSLADPNARWRNTPISPAQTSRLRRLGVTAPDDATKGQASDLILVHEGARRLKRLAPASRP